MALSAAELQKRHGLEGAPDPFPSLNGSSNNAPRQSATSMPSKPKSTPAPESVDPSDESAFPSLGGSAPAPSSSTTATKSLWSAATASSKVKAPLASAPGGLGRGASTAAAKPASLSFSLPSHSLNSTPKAFSELLKRVTESTGCSVEASTQMSTGLKTFFIKGSDERKCNQARKLIERGSSKIETVGFEVPLSTLGTIIGPKGATLKSITDATGVKIDIPKRDQLPQAPAATNGHADDDSDSDVEPEDPTVSISLTGPTPAIADAKKRISALIHTKVSVTTVKIKDIPSSFYPFIAGPRGSKIKNLVATMGEGQVEVHVPPPSVWKNLETQDMLADPATEGTEETPLGKSEKERKRDLAISIKGDKVKVASVVAEIRRQYEEAASNTRTMTIFIPKRQHRFLVGAAADEILEEHGCIIDLPPVEDPSEKVEIRGPPKSVGPALTVVMDKANAIAVETVEIVAIHRPAARDPVQHGRFLLRYLLRTSKLRQIADAHPGVKVYPPFAASVDATGTVSIEIVGEDKAQVSQAKEEVLQAVKPLTPAHIAPVNIDFAVHKFLIGKKGSKIAQFENTHSVKAVFAPESEQSSDVYLVYTGSNDDLPTDKKQREAKLQSLLQAASENITTLAGAAADIKTVELECSQKFHKAVIGPGGSTLRALLGEDSMATVNLPRKDAKENLDIITIKGPSQEVDQLVTRVNNIIEEAKADVLLNGHEVEFDVEQKYVAHLVGKGGENINKLRETLQVRINFDDSEASKGPKQPMAHCKIVGTREGIQEAKKRLLSQIESLADETTESVVIKRALHGSLIGSSGKYAIRLEERYGVKITFPRDKESDQQKDRQSQKPDEILIRGGKKSVASAKAELLEAAAHEEQQNQSVTFTVPTVSVARILGKGGASINAIKDDTGVQVDVDKTSDASTSITVKGEKKAIATAKASILQIVSEMGDQSQTIVQISHKHHRQLIGPGGQNLRDLIEKCGGPADQSKQSGMVNFPRATDASKDEVRLRGDAKLIEKIKAQLETAALALESTIVMGVRVPQNAHASKIGRGGSALLDLQRSSGATIQFPGSRQYNSAGTPENASELEDVLPTELVKVIGSKEACAKAIESLSIPVAQAPPRTGTPNGRNTPSSLPNKTVSFPSKYFHAVIDQGQLSRTLRQSGVQMDLPNNPPPKPELRQPEEGASVQPGAQSARIDLDAANEDGAEELNYHLESYENYGGLGEAGEVEIGLVLRGKEDVLDKGEEIVQAAIEKAKAATTQAILSGIPRSAFPRIIGSKGATISRIRAETGAQIELAPQGSSSDAIHITGDAESVGLAKDAIVSIASRQGARF